MDSSLLPLSARSYYVPLPVEVAPKASEKNEATNEVVVSFCGAPRIEDRAAALLEAITRAQKVDPTRTFTLNWLIDSQERGEAETLITESGATRVTLTEGRTPEVWHTLVRKSHLAVHTKFSVFGQLGPYLNVSLVEGTPSVVVNFGPGELLPEALVMKISSGRAGVNELKELILSSQEITAAKSEVIAEYGRELFDSEVVARELLAVFEASRPTLSALHARWGTFERDAKETLAREAQDLFSNDLFGAEILQPVFEELGWS
jgi:hypothetical protein